MLTGAFIESVFRCCIVLHTGHRKRAQDRYRYAQLEWETNSTLQLQRLAHEGIGLGIWSHQTNSVPVTERGEKLGVLDISLRKVKLARYSQLRDRTDSEEDLSRVQKQDHIVNADKS